MIGAAVVATLCGKGLLVTWLLMLLLSSFIILKVGNNQITELLLPPAVKLRHHVLNFSTDVLLIL